MIIINPEEELIESNKLFFKIFEENTIGMIFTDLETTKFLKVNNAFLTNSGYKKEEVIGKTSLDLNLIETGFRNKHLLLLKERGDLKNVEMLIRKKNGETFWSLTSIQTMLFNEKTYALTTFIDISEKKETEKKLKKSNELFFNLFDSNPIGMILTNLETTRFKYVNEEFLKCFKYTKSEVIGKTAIELNLIDPESNEYVLSLLNQQGYTGELEVVSRKKNGETFWTLASVRAITINEENHILTSFVDITERKKAEGQLAQLAAIVNFSDDAIISKSLYGTIESWNKGAEKIFGYTNAEAIGKNISFIIPPEYIKEEKDIVMRISNNETISHYETIRNKKSGEQFYVSLTVSPIKDESGKIIGISKIARDITDRKKAEDSSKLKDAFLSVISHEIRTPLNAIMGFSDILTKRKLGEQEKEYVNIIKSSGDDLLKIINDIIDMSKIESGTMTFESNSFSLKDIFQSLNEMLVGKAQTKNLTLLFTYDNEIPETLIGDEKRLSQILTNLVNNAIMFSEKGNINVFAKVLKKENENTLLEFTIKDVGIGISSDKIKTIFDRFRQVEDHDKRKHGGVGLGLSIAKRLVDLQSGMMSVESELNKGTTVTFSISYKN